MNSTSPILIDDHMILVEISLDMYVALPHLCDISAIHYVTHNLDKKELTRLIPNGRLHTGHNRGSPVEVHDLF